MSRHTSARWLMPLVFMARPSRRRCLGAMMIPLRREHQTDHTSGRMEGVTMRVMGACAAAVALLGMSPASADTAKGFAAYQHGDFATALKELQASAEKHEAQAYNGLA